MGPEVFRAVQLKGKEDAMIRTDERLRSRWLAAVAIAAAFALVGHPTAAAVVLLAWVPPTIALLALRAVPRTAADPHPLATPT